MQKPELEVLSPEHKIIRFLSKDGLMRTLGLESQPNPKNLIHLNPTFLLRSLKYYRNLEEKDPRGDHCENRVTIQHPEKGTLSNEDLNPTLVSCWSNYQRGNLEEQEVWDIFPDIVGAIESTVGDVKEIIDILAPTPNGQDIPHHGNWGSLRADFTRHGKINYYSAFDANFFDKIDPSLQNCFFKRAEPYSKENEYRFSITCGIHRKFYPDMFCAQLKPDLTSTDYIPYIKKIYLKRDRISTISEKERTGMRVYFPNKVEEI